MNIPEAISNLTISSWIPGGPYPPLGFLMLEEENDCFGNYYGLYWEFGKENKEPIVCWFDHEEGYLAPTFASLHNFIQWYNTKNKEEFVEYGELFTCSYNKGRLLGRKHKIEQAISSFSQSIELFEEFSPSWYELSALCFKSQRLEMAEQAAINSIKANWTFGLPTKKAIENLDNIGDSEFARKDPLASRRHQLALQNTFSSGFTINYEVLLECIHEYSEKEDHISAAVLLHNYGVGLCCYANKAVRDLMHFDLEEWQSKLAEYCSENLNNRVIKF